MFKTSSDTKILRVNGTENVLEVQLHLSVSLGCLQRHLDHEDFDPTNVCTDGLRNCLEYWEVVQLWRQDLVEWQDLVECSVLLAFALEEYMWLVFTLPVVLLCLILVPAFIISYITSASKPGSISAELWAKTNIPPLTIAVRCLP